MRVYCIPGVGGGEKIFSRLRLKQAEVVPLKWLQPERGENLPAYAKRLAAQIDSSLPFWLLGVSFGGMVAIEISRFLSPGRVVLVSSVKSRGELPWYGRLLGKMGVHRLVAMPLARSFVAPASHFLGIETEEDYRLAKELVHSTSGPFLRWSIRQSWTWNPESAPPANLVHIHGTADRIFPARFVNPDIWIKGGGHFMIVSRADEISALLDRLVTMEGS